jgi:hypothetical protein
MNYEALSTFSLLRLLNDCPGDSAEHRAIELELRRRDTEKPRPDKHTKLLFPPEEWKAITRR